MNCPVCKTVNLVMTERQGIEIDYCSQCRGVWLDRGELDKIIERSASGASVSARPEHRTPAYPTNSHERYDDDDHRGEHYKKRRREGFLSELFDFD